jgi:hypothetical protein
MLPLFRGIKILFTKTPSLNASVEKSNYSQVKLGDSRLQAKVAHFSS